MQYRNGLIDFIQTEEDIARRSGTGYIYEYNLSDHLGNVRYSFRKNNSSFTVEPLQADNYYAFGLRKPFLVGSTDNKYLYNGKELQDELSLPGQEGQYDYGARFYDPVVGRFNTIDPLSEKSRRFSSYSYAMDNPIRFIDVDGMYAAPPPDWVVDKDNNVRWRANVTSATDKDLNGDTYIGKTGYYTAQKTGYTVQLHNKDNLVAGEKSWDYYVPNNRFEQEPDGQTAKTEVGNGDGELPTLNETGKDILTGVSIGADANQGMLQLLKLDKDLIKDVAGASKLLEGTGTVLGITSLLNDGANIINKGVSNASAADWIKLGISGGQLLLKSNPWTIGLGLIYGIADATGNNPVDYIFK